MNTLQPILKKASLALLAMLAPLAQCESAAEHFGVDQYLALQYISAIDVSPDGLFVAYTATYNDLEADTTHDTVWVQAIAGGEPLRMTSLESDSSSPRWSPDGRFLAVASDRKDDKTQVWLFDRRGGDAQQLTDYKQGIQSYQWSPDGKQLLLVVEDATPADLDEEQRPNPRPYVIDRLQFKEDYVGYLDRYRAHVHVIDIASRETRQVTFGDYDDSEPAWAPDSRQIVFVSNRTGFPDRNRNTDLWIVDVAKERDEPRRLTTQETADASPSWSPDGRFIAYTSTVPHARLPIYAIPQLTTIDIATGKSTVVAALAETQVFSPRYAPDGAALLAITEYRGEQNLVTVELKSGAVQSLVEGADIVTEFDVAPNGAIVLQVARPEHPDEIFALDNSALRQLSFVNKAVLQDLTLATMQKFAYRSDDDMAMEVFIVLPPGYKKGRTYPGLLHIHGGPQQQWDYRFDSEAQLIAATGFVVVMPNPRGSWGYGQAFAEAIYQDWGGVDYRDLMAAMDFAVDRGYVDANRMAVYGWSYGGMLTNHVITKTDRFRAAISGASATLYSANYGHDQYQRWWEEELGLPWLAENREKWERISPFYSLDKVTTPTLIVGGEQDWNVPIINSEQLYIALKRQGIPTELVVYPGEGHVLSVPSYEKDLYERYFSWLERYVGH